MSHTEALAVVTVAFKVIGCIQVVGLAGLGWIALSYVRSTRSSGNN